MGKGLKRITLGRRALSHLLAKKKFPIMNEAESENEIKDLQLKMLRIQQGIWHSKRRAIILFEGFDAAGKGGAIRRLTETLDPRGLRVHPIGPPMLSEEGRHYLYRFWSNLPLPGTIAIFDRSWYGRVLVERVENLTSKSRWQEAYAEINEFEKMLVGDGIDLVKIFLVIHPQEQLKRFESRLHDPYKQWKLTDEDLEAHRKWEDYIRASDDIFSRTHSKVAEWNLIPADSKEYAKVQVLKIATHALSHHSDWIETVAQIKKRKDLQRALKKLQVIQKQK
jgi:polyphosphate kinase 2 (PPK2 family)